MIIKPFKGIRPDKKYITLVNVPPYDVVSLNDVKKAIQNNPYSFFHVTRSEADLPDPANEYSNDVYNKAKENYDLLLKDNILIRDENESFYLLSQKWKGKTQIGLCAAVSCWEYEKELIKKHELTRKDKEFDRTKHIYTVKADTGPVFLAFNDNIYKKGNFINLVKHIFDKLPVYDFIDENDVNLKLWIINENRDIESLKDFFKKIGAFYIADGHHRAASAVNVWKKMKNDQVTPYEYFLAVIFPASQLRICPYNRVVSDLNGLTTDKFLERLKDNFLLNASPSIKPKKKGNIGLYLDKSNYIMTINDSIVPENPLESLDVSILQKYILSPILGIDDPRTSTRINFIGGNAGDEDLTKIVDNGNAKAAFSLFPVNINDLIKITESSCLMPPKSTWFEPKLRDGLVIYSLE